MTLTLLIAIWSGSFGLYHVVTVSFSMFLILPVDVRHKMHGYSIITFEQFLYNNVLTLKYFNNFLFFMWGNMYINHKILDFFSFFVIKY